MTDGMVETGHVPVLLQEAVDALRVRDGGVYLDGTFGGGGHARAILSAGGPATQLVAVDADPAAIARAERLRDDLPDPAAVTTIHTNFRDLAAALDAVPFTSLDGVLFDLGVSSYQVDTPERGFSFRFDAPLDMRFDPTSGPSAAALLATLPEGEIADLLHDYGEERQSRRIAAAIVRSRSEGGIRTTSDLATLVERTIGRRPGANIHPATRTFQALRIAVNDELDALRAALEASLNRLVPGGRMVVIAFHSLEDRIVKRFMVDNARGCICPPHQPVCTCAVEPRLRRVGKPVRPSEEEVGGNVRSRSSIMRIAERI